MPHKMHIIAGIYLSKLALASLEDARKMLEIIERATPVSENHELPWPHRFYTRETTGERLMDIEVINTTLHSEEDANRLIDAARDKRNAEKAGAAKLKAA